MVGEHVMDCSVEVSDVKSLGHGEVIEKAFNEAVNKPHWGSDPIMD